jgi:hypothetical protein
MARIAGKPAPPVAHAVSTTVALFEVDGNLGLSLVNPAASTDADREAAAASAAPLYVALAHLRPAARAHVVAAIQRAATRRLVGTVRWFELFLQVASGDTTDDLVAEFATFAAQPVETWSGGGS